MRRSSDIHDGSTVHVGGFSPRKRHSQLPDLRARTQASAADDGDDDDGGPWRSQNGGSARGNRLDDPTTGGPRRCRSAFRGAPDCKTDNDLPGDGPRGHPGPFEPLLESGEAEVELIGQGASPNAFDALVPGSPPSTLLLARDIRCRGQGSAGIQRRSARHGAALPADFAVIRAAPGGPIRKSRLSGSPTFNATMAGAARVTIAEVDEIVALGELQPEAILRRGFTYSGSSSGRVSRGRLARPLLVSSK